VLQEVCEEIRNYFISSREVGTFTIADGVLSPSVNLKEGQRVLIAGSDLNDGIYTYHAGGFTNDDDTAGAGLADEVFTGAVCGLSIPPQVIALTAEITEWVGKYGGVIASPYASESFGGYSYTRATVGKADGSSGSADWRDVFGNRLNRWRKVSFQC
jgi:hypothetical protein